MMRESFLFCPSKFEELNDTSVVREGDLQE